MNKKGISPLIIVIIVVAVLIVGGLATFFIVSSGELYDCDKLPLEEISQISGYEITDVEATDFEFEDMERKTCRMYSGEESFGSVIVQNEGFRDAKSLRSEDILMEVEDLGDEAFVSDFMNLEVIISGKRKVTSLSINVRDVSEEQALEIAREIYATV